MIDVAYRYHGGAGRKNLADIRRFHQDYAIDGRGYDRVGQLSVDEGYLSALALDIGAAGYHVLLLPGHVQLLRLGPLDAGSSAGHLGAGGFDLFLARTLFDQRQMLLGLAQRGCGGFGVLAVLIELRGGDVILLVEDLGAFPVFLGALAFGARSFDGGGRFFDFLRARAGFQLAQAGLRRVEVGAALIEVAGLAFAGPLYRG